MKHSPLLHEAVLESLLGTIEHGLVRASHASFYQSPGDMLFGAIGAVCSWLDQYVEREDRSIPPLSFTARIVDEAGFKKSWWRSSSLSQELAQQEERATEHLLMHMPLPDSGLELIFGCHVSLDHQHPDYASCRHLADRIEASWMQLFEEKSTEACLTCCLPSPAARTMTAENSRITARGRCMILQRLRECLQRLEEELPEDYRRFSNDRLAPLDLHFIWWTSPLDPDHSAPCPVMTHQRLRHVLESSAEAHHLSSLANSTYETPLSRPDAEPAFDCLDFGAPVFSSQPACNFPSSGKESGEPDRAPRFLYWPISVLGSPILCLQLYVHDDRSTFPEQLIHGLLQLQEASWNILFDVYHDILVELFGDCYLDMDLTEHRPSEESQQLASFVSALRNATAFLSVFFGIPALQWELEDEAPPLSISLDQLRNEAALGEEMTSSPKMEMDAEARLKILEREKQRLKRIHIHPVGLSQEQPSERLTMFRHLSWRLGHYIHHQLPEVLMTVEHHLRHRMEREQSAIRHELGGLITQARRVLLRLSDTDSRDLQDLKLLMRLMQGTVQNIGHAGRVNDVCSGGQTHLPAFFDSIERLFPSLFQMRLENGQKACCRVLSLLEQAVTLPVPEEQFLTLWRNLWDNGRRALIDHGRDSIGDERQEIRQAILDRYGSYTHRHPPRELPVPFLITLISHHGENRSQLFLDVLDNSPALCGDSLLYPISMKPGHHGLRLVQETCDYLNQNGLICQFTPIHALDDLDFKRLSPYHRQLDALGQPLDGSRWSITSIRIDLDGAPI